MVHLVISGVITQVVEGETPLLLPEVSPTGEELSEHREEEREERCTLDEEENSAELQRLCQRCHIVTSQLRRQATALTGGSSLQVRSEIILGLYRIYLHYIVLNLITILYGFGILHNLSNEVTQNTQYYIKAYDAILYRTVLHYIVKFSCHIISYHRIISYHTAAYCDMLNHIKSYLIILAHISSKRLYCLVLCCIDL